MRARMMRAEGHRAWTRERGEAPKVRKSIDNASVVVKEKARKVPKAAGVRRRLVMKYSTRLKAMLLQIVYGRSQSMDDMASAKGWYCAYSQACFSTMGR